MSENQNAPIQDGNTASNADKAQGIADQVRADAQLGNADADVAGEITERTAAAGVEMSGADTGTLADDIDRDKPAE